MLPAGHCKLCSESIWNDLQSSGRNLSDSEDRILDMQARSWVFCNWSRETGAGKGQEEKGKEECGNSKRLSPGCPLSTTPAQVKRPVREMDTEVTVQMSGGEISKKSEILLSIFVFPTVKKIQGRKVVFSYPPAILPWCVAGSSTTDEVLSHKTLRNCTRL